MIDVNKFEALKIGIASPEKIREWSFLDLQKTLNVLVESTRELDIKI